jgi:hypothetical protein
MSLPTTNLTLHLDASQNASPTTMYSDDAGTTPAVGGNSVRVHTDQGDGSISTHFARVSGSETGPTWVASGNLMKNPELQFGAGAVHMQLASFQTDNSTARPTTDFVSTTAGTIACVLYPTTITDTHTLPSQSDSNDFVFGNAGGNANICLYDNSGTKTLRFVVVDSAHEVVDFTIALNRTWIAIMTFDGATLTGILIDDTGAESTSTTSVGTATGLSSQLAYGHSANPGTPFFTGRWGEGVTYNAALTGTNLSDLKQFYKDKWLSLVTQKRFLLPSAI